MSAALAGRRSAKRAQIAAAARKLFLEHGFAATSMDAVTAEAGVSKQTLYRYFPTKVALLTDILYGGLANFVIRPPDLDQLNTTADLRRSMVDFATFFTQNVMQPETMALVRLVLGEAFRVAEIRRAFRDALPAQILARTELVIRHSADRGLIATDDPELAARMFVGPLMTYVALDGFLSVEPSPPPSRRELERLVDAFLATVAVTP